LRTRIICLGNELVRDDGAAIHVARALAALPLPTGTEVEIRANLGFDLLEMVQGDDRLILVDAMSTGRAPGTCVVQNGREIERYAVSGAPSHSLGVAELMELAHHMRPDKPLPEVVFVGIEGRAFGEYGNELSPEVSAAIPVAVELVRKQLG
jgi:hydrogenase maturation protease